MYVRTSSRLPPVANINGIERAWQQLTTLVGIMNSEIIWSIHLNSRPVKCWFQMANIFSLWIKVDISMSSFGIKKESAGWNLPNKVNPYFGLWKVINSNYEQWIGSSHFLWTGLLKLIISRLLLFAIGKAINLIKISDCPLKKNIMHSDKWFHSIMLIGSQGKLAISICRFGIPLVLSICLSIMGSTILSAMFGSTHVLLFTH